MEAKKELRIYDGATAIITGGASGIGQAIAEELAKRGCEVVLADLQFELAQKVALEIRAAGGKATAVKLDVMDYPAVEQVVRDAVVRTGNWTICSTMPEYISTVTSIYSALPTGSISSMSIFGAWRMAFTPHIRSCSCRVSDILSIQVRLPD